MFSRDSTHILYLTFSGDSDFGDGQFETYFYQLIECYVHKTISPSNSLHLIYILSYILPNFLKSSFFRFLTYG